MTGLIDALEDSGLVERRPHPTDRRAIHVTLTNQGEEAIAYRTSRSRQLAKRVFSDIHPEDLERLITTIDVILERLDAPKP